MTVQGKKCSGSNFSDEEAKKLKKNREIIDYLLTEIISCIRLHCRKSKVRLDFLDN